ncbi:hypothetical protein M413DRAFT_342140 [Hebeloma cylindrosporum]|uniref:Uncharacterized protein n=1 Tax=Hebeloma cylindrosporum TaxID=76867 RepID=A0A0C2YWY5_HEBCY|nr:hypothetical protein M413DRAFT_342140 [Hebeloma cylindrosporum h7]
MYESDCSCGLLYSTTYVSCATYTNPDVGGAAAILSPTIESDAGRLSHGFPFLT